MYWYCLYIYLILYHAVHGVHAGPNMRITRTSIGTHDNSQLYSTTATAATAAAAAAAAANIAIASTIAVRCCEKKHDEFCCGFSVLR